MADTWLNDAFDLTVAKEGFSAKPYWDVNAWRIGYGSDTVTLPDGTVKRVTQNTAPITKMDAGRDLTRSIPVYTATIIKQIGQDKWDALEDKTRGSLFSVGYNYGSLPKPLAGTINGGGDKIDIASSIAALGARAGINNPARRKDEANYALQPASNALANNALAYATPVAAKPAPAAPQPVAEPQMASDDDAFSATFGKKSTAPATSAAGPTIQGDDPFAAAFGKKPEAAAPAAAGPKSDATPPVPVRVPAAGVLAKGDRQPVANPQPPAPTLTSNGVAEFDPSLKGYPDDGSSYRRGDPLYLRSHAPVVVTPDSPLGKADAGVARGVQDVGDTAAWAGTNALAAGARGAANLNLLNPKIADAIAARAAEVEATNTKGRKEWEAAHPASPPLWGVIPTDPASIGRVGGQIMATAPFGGPVSKFAGNAAGMLSSNPLVRGAIQGSIIGGGQAAAVSKGSDASLTEQAITGATIGGLFGAGAPILWHGGKTIFDKLFGSATISDKALQTFNSYLDQLGMTPEEANAALNKLGPDATYADLDASLRTRAAALAGRGGETTSTLRGSYAERAKEGPERTRTAVDDILGPAPDVTRVLDSIETEAQKAGGPHYKAAYASTDTLNASPVIIKINDALQTSKGGTTKALEKAKSYLFSKDADGNMILDDTVEQLHSARIELDAEIARLKKNPSDDTATTRAIGAMQDVRKQVDDLLKTNPEMKAGDAAYAGIIKLQDTFETGQGVFKNATRKEDLQRLFDNATPQQVAALRAGARTAINDTLDNTARGELSGAETMFGKKSANRDKLKIVFGDKADEVLDLVEANATKRRTENAVLTPSATAELTAAQKEWQHKPKQFEDWLGPVAAGIIGHGITGDYYAGAGAGMAMKAAMTAINKLEQRGVEVTAKDMAKILGAAGVERDQITNMLGKSARTAGWKSAFDRGVNTAIRTAPGVIQENSRVKSPTGFAPRLINPNMVIPPGSSVSRP